MGTEIMTRWYVLAILDTSYKKNDDNSPLRHPLIYYSPVGTKAEAPNLAGEEDDNDDDNAAGVLANPQTVVERLLAEATRRETVRKFMV